MRCRSIIAMLLVVGGCSGPSGVTATATADTSATATAPSTNPPHRTVTSTTSLPSSTIQPQPVEPALTATDPMAGTLLDGTPFDVETEPMLRERVTSIAAGVQLDLSGDVVPVGALVVVPGPSTGALLEGNGLSVAAGDWTVEVAMDGAAIELMGERIGSLLVGAITPGRDGAPPTIVLTPPLAWAPDDVMPMEVRYETLAVRRGCGPDALACNETGAVQVVAIDFVLPSPALEVWVLSDAPRPSNDANYLDPGPLQIRGGHDVLWTGTEMIVWGGATGDRPAHLIDGAALDPAANQWRRLSAPPLDGERETRAAWTGERMVVVSSQATLAYDPAADEWAIIGTGLRPPLSSQFLAPIGTELFAWTPGGFFMFDTASGSWGEIEGPGVGAPNGWEGSMLVVDDVLYVAGLVGARCYGRRFVARTGEDWQPLPAVSLATSTYADCSLANQVGAVGGRLIVWDDGQHPVMAYNPDDERWLPAADIPLGGIEGPSGPVTLGPQRMLVPQWGQAAIYDGTTDEWIRTPIPGTGENTHMVWTGTEVLSWGGACCYGDGRNDFRSMDAWRWTPPPP